MDTPQYDKYIKEMLEMQKRAKPAVANTTVAAEIRPPQNPNMDGSGFLGVNVTTTRELYPVRNARVRVFTGSVDSPLFIADGNTDESGKTELFALAAPPLSLSQTPDPASPPFATYNILVEADGFLPAIYMDAVVFDKVTSIQNVNLIPKTAYNENDKNIFGEMPDYDL